MEMKKDKKKIEKTNNKNKIKGGPENEPKMRYFKIPLCQNFL